MIQTPDNRNFQIFRLAGFIEGKGMEKGRREDGRIGKWGTKREVGWEGGTHEKAILLPILIYSVNIRRFKQFLQKVITYFSQNDYITSPLVIKTLL